MRKILPAVVLSALALSGCWSRPEVEETKPPKTKSEAPAPEKPSTAPKVVQRKTMEGNWVVEKNEQISQQGHLGWLPMFVVKVTKSKSGKYVPQVLDALKPFQGWQISQTASEIGEKSARLVLTRQGRELDIEVSLGKTDALGNILSKPDTLDWTVPMRWLATDETELKAFLPPVPHESLREFDDSMNRFMQQQDPEAVDVFVKKHPRNALSFFAIFLGNPLLAIKTSKDARPDPKDIRAHVKRLDQLKPVWGARAALLARLNLAGQLTDWIAPSRTFARKDVNLDIADEIVRNAEGPSELKRLNDAQKLRLSALKQHLAVRRDAQAVLSSKDPRQRAAAMDRIERFLQTAPRYQPWLTYVLAEGNRAAGQIDKALERYARLYVMPSASFDLERQTEARWRKTPDLHQRLEELWTAKHKKPDKAGLDAYLDRNYGTLLHAVLPDVVATRPAPLRRRTHLCELFTSCDAIFSVGADITAQMLQRSYKPADLVVLCYHLDDPGPNPLVCNDSKLRAFDCQVAAPPIVLIDGKPLDVVINGQTLVPDLRSTMDGVPRIMALVRRTLQNETAADKPGFRIHVTATARNGRLTINAEADGPKEADPDLRLRIVLAEDRIAYTGKNGIRYHNMVVRSMPAGIDGVALTGGKTTYSNTIDLSDLSGRLRDFLTSLEENSPAKLSVKPVGFKKLHVVAFVQSTKGRRDVLQVAQAVVGGLDAQTKPAAPKKKKAAGNTAKPKAPAKRS